MELWKDQPKIIWKDLFHQRQRDSKFKDYYAQVCRCHGCPLDCSPHQEEDYEEYVNPMILSSTIADMIKSKTEMHLKNVQDVVSSKPIVMRAEYACCPNLTNIDTPGFVLKVVLRGISFKKMCRTTMRKLLLRNLAESSLIGLLPNLTTLIKLTDISNQFDQSEAPAWLF